MQSVLVLENGSVWEGRSVGAPGQVYGEVVFNTSMIEYQDLLTDAAYSGQILTMTYPLIGNYGISTEAFESGLTYPRGLVMGEISSQPSHWRSAGTLSSFMAEHGVVGICGIDTRALTRMLRQEGTMKGTIATGDVDLNELQARIAAAPTLSDQDLVQEATISTPFVYHEGDGKRIVVIDLGSKHSILRCLSERNCNVVVAPAYIPAEVLLAMRPDGVVYTNGPGDPRAASKAVETVRRLLGLTPIFGIGLGHQLLALSLGADTFKLKYGHRGANHPVQDLQSGRVYITSQSHGFAVSEESLTTDLLVTHRSLNDGTIEGLRHRYLNVSSVQYNPDMFADAAERDSVFGRFLAELQRSA